MNKSFVQKICEQRDKKIISSYLKGERLELIEAFFGITRQRIYQILEAYKIPRNRQNQPVDNSAVKGA